jgi:hypothetical protein
VRLWHANLGRGVSAREFTRNFELLLAGAGPRAVIALQEIDEADRPEEADIVRRLTRKTHEIVGARTAVPILVPHHLPIVDERVTRACDGLAGFTPHRVVTEAVIRLRPNLTPGILNTHLPIARPETAERRALVRQTLRQRARSHPVGAWVADTNTREDWPTIVRGEQSVTAAGIDRAKAWSSRGEVEVMSRETVALTIDNHDAHGARIRFE